MPLEQGKRTGFPKRERGNASRKKKERHLTPQMDPVKGQKKKKDTRYRRGE